LPLVPRERLDLGLLRYLSIPNTDKRGLVSDVRRLEMPAVWHFAIGDM
jgi:hypothetical protein